MEGAIAILASFVRLLAEIDGGVTPPGHTVTAAAMAAMAAERTPESETQGARGLWVTFRYRDEIPYHMTTCKQIDCDVAKMYVTLFTG